MTAPTNVADRLWTEFNALPHESQADFLSRLLTDDAMRREIEDLLDLAIAHERAAEPTRPLRDVLSELGA